MTHSLPSLSYAYDALSENIDATTMEIHYSKHHQGYVDKLNAAIKGTEAESHSLEALIKNISQFDMAVRNNAGGHFNHSLFWQILSPSPQRPSDDLQKAIADRWSSLDKFKEAFAQAAATRFGSGWAWLIVKPNGSLEITSTPNQDNPLMDVIATDRGTPILGLDVWEHAYYLKYQNRRPDYIEAFWNVVNWEKVGELFNEHKA